MPQGSPTRAVRRGWSALSIVALSAVLAVGSPLAASADETVVSEPTAPATVVEAPVAEATDAAETVEIAEPAESETPVVEEAPSPAVTPPAVEVVAPAAPVPATAPVGEPNPAPPVMGEDEAQFLLRLIGPYAYPDTIFEWMDRHRFIATNAETQEEIPIGPIGGGLGSEATFEGWFGRYLPAETPLYIRGEHIDGTVVYYDGTDIGTLDPSEAKLVTLTPGEERVITINWDAIDAGPPVTPIAPSADALTDGTRGGIDVPATGVAGQNVTVALGAAYAGTTVNGWLFSAPLALGQAVVDASGNVTFTLPSSVAPGAHRLAITDAENTLLGWGDIRVSVAATGEDTSGEDASGEETASGGTAGGGTAGTPVSHGTLAATGPEDSFGLAASALLLVAMGAAIVIASRRAQRA